MTVHVLTIDSRDRNYDAYPEPSSYRVMLPRKYRRVTSAKLLSAELPSSFYVFSAAAGNTTMTVVMNGGSPVTVTMPDANYEPDTFCTVLEAMLEDSTGVPWTVLISRTTMRLTMSNANSTEFVVGPWSSSKRTEWGLGYFMGFLKDTTYASTGGSLSGPRSVQLNPVNYVFVDIEELNGIDEAGLEGGAMGNGSFAKVPVAVNSFDYAFLDSKSCMPTVRFTPELPTLDRLRVRLRFHDGRLIDFSGVEHSFTLEIHTRDRVDPVSNAGEALTDAASTAAATAAAAAVTAAAMAESMRKKRRGPRPPPPPPEKWSFDRKRHSKWVCAAALMAFGVWYVYKKRTITAPLESAKVNIAQYQ